MLWLAHIKPSIIHQCLTLALAAAALLASASLSVPATIKITACLAITLLSGKQILKLRQTTTLSMYDTSDTKPIWRVQRPGYKPLSGTLIQAGYRSAGLVVLVVQSDDTLRYRVPVWVDSVTATQFSHLHFQIAFNARPAQRPTLKTVLSLLSSQGSA